MLKEFAINEYINNLNWYEKDIINLLDTIDTIRLFNLEDIKLKATEEEKLNFIKENIKELFLISKNQNVQFLEIYSPLDINNLDEFISNILTYIIDILLSNYINKYNLLDNKILINKDLIGVLELELTSIEI